MPKIVYIGVILLIVTFIFVASAGSTMGTQGEALTGEAFIPSTASPVDLNFSNIENAIYDPYPKVKTSSGNLTAQGQDYKFFPNNGTILSITGGSLDGVGSATIDYQYSQQNQWTKSISDMFGGLSNGLIPGMVLMVVISLLFVSFKNLTQ